MLDGLGASFGGGLAQAARHNAIAGSAVARSIKAVPGRAAGYSHATETRLAGTEVSGWRRAIEAVSYRAEGRVVRPVGLACTQDRSREQAARTTALFLWHGRPRRTIWKSVGDCPGTGLSPAWKLMQQPTTGTVPNPPSPRLRWAGCGDSPRTCFQGLAASGSSTKRASRQPPCSSRSKNPVARCFNSSRPLPLARSALR